MHPLNTTARPSSESTIGWWPRLERSMMARRRCPRATPPADHIPAPSGPRGAMTSAMRATAPTSGRRPSTRTSPAIPHISTLPNIRQLRAAAPESPVATQARTRLALEALDLISHNIRREAVVMSERGPTDELAPPPRVEEVSEGIYAYLQPDGQWGLNNPAFLVGSRAVTLIDTCFTQRRTQALLDSVHSISHPPIATLFNTHEH